MGIEELLLEKAKHDGLKKTIRNLIIKHGWTDEQIAGVTEVSADLVKKVRASLKKQRKDT